MDVSTTNLLMDAIPQTGFAAFLLWQYIQQKGDMSLLRKESRQQEQEIRERYSVVIKDLTNEKDNLREDLNQRVERLGGRLTELEKTIVGLVAKFEQFSEQIRDIRNNRL